MTDAASIAAKRAEIARRYERPRRQQVSLASLRISELHRLRHARYPDGIPDTPKGRVMVRVLIHHLAGRPGDPRKRLPRWIEDLAPWMAVADARALLNEALTMPRTWRADRLAWRLGLTSADRAALRITTIGAVDESRQQRATKRREAKRQREQERRKAAGSQPRAEYLAEQAATPKPWLALGMSRASWYRAGKPQP